MKILMNTAMACGVTACCTFFTFFALKFGVAFDFEWSSVVTFAVIVTICQAYMYFVADSNIDSLREENEKLRDERDYWREQNMIFKGNSE